MPGGLRLRDRRVMEGNIERREQHFRDGEREDTIITHRRYVSKAEMVALLGEAGFSGLRCLEGADLATLHPLRPDEPATGSYMIIATCS